jgi:hypothetical protein
MRARKRGSAREATGYDPGTGTVGVTNRPAHPRPRDRPHGPRAGKPDGSVPVSDELHDPDVFRLYFPVYVVFGSDGKLIGYDLPGVGRVLAMFTDEDLARRFVEARNVSQAAIRRIGVRETLYGPLEIAAQQVGVTHVGIDPTETGPRRSFVFPMREFINRTGP